MPLPTSKKNVGLGRSIINAKAKETQNKGHSSYHTTDLLNPATNGPGLRSVTHQGDLEEFLNTAQLAEKDFTAERRNVTVVQAPGSAGGAGGSRNQNPFLLSNQEEKEVLSKHDKNRKRLRVPRRPNWNSTTTPEQLRRMEAESLLDWRRGLAQLTEANNFVLTPFERNLEVWRQLWRVVERSHLVIQIVDARNPLRFRCEDLERYVEEIEVRLGEKEVSKVNGNEDSESTPKKGKRRNLLLINKADLLDEGQRREWARYFESQGIEYAFFSAANAAALQAARAEAEAAAASAQYDSGEEEEGEDSDSSDDEVQVMQQQAAAVELGAPSAKVLVGQEAAYHILEASQRQVQEALRNERRKGHEGATQINGSLMTDQEQGSSDETTKDPARLLNVLELEDLFMAKAPPLEDFETEEYGVPSKLVVGLVGYPNVGKSSTINALLGEKKVSVSATPGKTKHFQTINLSNSVTLCDCPGLVFPQFATTSAELVLDGVLPIDQMREYTAPGELVARRIPKDIIEGTYGFRIAIEDREEGGSGLATGLEVLTAYAIARGYARQGQGNPDESRAARYVFKDYMNAKLLYGHPPPGVDGDDFNEEQRDRARASLAGRKLAPPSASEASAADKLNAPTAMPGKKSKALDAAFFDTNTSGFMTTGRGKLSGQNVLRGKINDDGTEADPSQTNKPAVPPTNGSKKHHKGKKRQKQRSGQGYV
jgi:large subunit GTPase 1